jgi:hypothetical protein
MGHPFFKKVALFLPNKFWKPKGAFSLSQMLCRRSSVFLSPALNIEQRHPNLYQPQQVP